MLVENRFAFNISIVREQTNDLERTAQAVAQLTGGQIEAILEALDRNKRLPAYRPIVVLRDATEAQIASVAAHRLADALPSVAVHFLFPPRGAPVHRRHEIPPWKRRATRCAVSPAT